MANSTSPVPQVAEGTGAVRQVNELNDAASQTMIGGRNARGITTPLQWAYLGGRINGINVANGTVTLTASTTNYIVMKKSDGVVSTSTATTNWDNSSDYWRLYSVVTGSASVTSYADERSSVAGLFGLAGSGTAAGSTTQVQYNSSGGLAGSASFTWDNANSRVNTVNITTTGLILTAASAVGGAGFRLPHGAAPTAPTNGDIWTDTTGLYARINGATVGPYATSAGSLTNPMTTIGDIIIGGAAGAPARLAAGAAGTFLGSNGAGVAPSYQTPGVTPGNLTLSDYSWVNQLAATATETASRLTITGGTVASDSWNILKKSLTLTAGQTLKITAFGEGKGAASPANQGMGLVLRESGTGKFVVLMWQPNASSAGGAFVWTSPTIFGSTVIAFPLFTPKISPKVFTARYTGTQWYFAWSLDDIFYTEFGPYTIASFTPNEVGFGVNSVSSTSAAMLYAARLEVI